MTTPTYQVDRNRWGKFSLFEQMGNIGSEVGRTFEAKRKGDSELAQHAVMRALDLFDATIECLISQKSNRIKEVLRSKDQFLHIVYDEVSDLEARKLETYFMQFAIAARTKR